MRIEVAKLSVRNTTNDIKTFLWDQKTMMVPQPHRQSLSLKKKIPLSQNLQRRLKRKKTGASGWRNLKTRTARQKLGITNQKKEVTTNPQQHEKCCKKWLPSNKHNLSEPSPKRPSKVNWSSNPQLTKFRTEERHEERVITNTFWAFILCFLNCEPSHATTLQKS